jgi:C-terminal processing protease CtpA/Prc
MIGNIYNHPFLYYFELMFNGILKSKIIYAIILFFVFTGAVFIYLRSLNDETKSFVFSNNMNCNVNIAVDANQKNLHLLEFCKVWGVLKYHEKNNSKALAYDLFLIKNFNHIYRDKLNLDNVIANALSGQNRNNQNIFLGNIPDQNWIKESRTINNLNKKRLINYIADSTDITSANGLVNVNDYDELNFDSDSLYFNKQITSQAERFLSLCRVWNTVRYFYPYFNELSSDWNNTFLEMLPYFLYAKNELEYHKAVIRLSTKLYDSHVAVKSSLIDNFEKKHVGNIIFKTVKERTFVKEFVTKILKSNMKKGDEILEINGTNVKKIRDSLKEFISASNNITLDRDINKQLLILKSMSANIKLIREKKIINIRENLTFINIAREENKKEQRSSASRSVSKILPNNIGYLNIKDIYSGNFRISMEKIKNCNAIIFDVRSYPNEVGVDFLRYFATRKLKFMNLFRADIRYPGLMISAENKIKIPQSISDSFSKPVVILVNEYTQSQSESIALAMSSISNSVTLGENTAGTNGNVSILYLPGNLKLRISGIGVLGANGETLQRNGIQPQIIVKDNINSLVKGEDYQLLTAIKYLKKII